MKEVTLKNIKGKTYALKVKLEVNRLSGFTGHSDRKELIEYAKKLIPRPKKYIFVHGEASKCKALARHVSKIVKRDTDAPPIGTSTRLY